MSDTKEDQDKLTEEETAKRRDEALRKMLSTPPTPHKTKSVKDSKTKPS